MCHLQETCWSPGQWRSLDLWQTGERKGFVIINDTGSTDTHIKGKSWCLCFTMYKKIMSRCTTGLNVKEKAKILEWRIAEYSHKHARGTRFKQDTEEPPTTERTGGLYHNVGLLFITRLHGRERPVTAWRGRHLPHVYPVMHSGTNTENSSVSTRKTRSKRQTGEVLHKRGCSSSQQTRKCVQVH